MNLYKKPVENLFLALLFLVSLVLSADVFSEQIIQAYSEGVPSHIREFQYYPDKTSAQEACVARAGALGFVGYCGAATSPPQARADSPLIEYFIGAGWLCSGGPTVGGVCSQMPFYLLTYYYDVVCDFGTPLDEHKGCANPNRTQSCSTKHPVNIATGSKFFQITDYQHQNHPLLRLTRTYDSSDGRWQFNFSSSVFIQASRLRVIEESGQSISFRKVGDTWVTENGGNYTLESVNGLWEYRNGSTTKYYNAQNRLVTIKTPQYEDINIAYPSPGVAVISSDSASVSVTYQDHMSNVLSASLPDGATITYNYDTQGRLVQVDNRGQTENYRYDNPAFPTAITSVLGGDGNVYKEITYHPDGRVHTSALLNGADIKTFTYPQNNSTSVTNALEKETIYSFEEFWGEKKVSSVQGVATANCVGANKNYTYYPSGLLQTKTDWKNNTTSYQYNTRNLESSRTEALGTPQERTITTEWHPTFNLRTKVTESDRETNFVYDAEGRLLSQSSNESPLN